MYGYMTGNTVNVTTVSGDTRSIDSTSLTEYAFLFKEYGQSVQNTHIVLGSSSVAPVVTDHCLGTDVTDSLTLVSGNMSNAVTSGTGYVCTITATFRNDTAADVSVSEIGVTANLALNNGCNFMVSRDVIETVTIQPGKTATFTVTITI